MNGEIKAHRSSQMARQYPPAWREGAAADAAGIPNGTHRPNAYCTFCGSMTPGELVTALRAGATVHWADRKYGWPHKLYIDGVPNRFADLPESVQSTSRRSDDPMPEDERVRGGYELPVLREEVTQTSIAGVVYKRQCVASLDYRVVRAAPATTHGKFYSEHLQDATNEERDVIERAMGIEFAFDEAGGVSWRPFSAAA